MATTGPNTSLRAHLHVGRDVGEHRRPQHAVVVERAAGERPSRRRRRPRRPTTTTRSRSRLRDERRHVGGLVERIADHQRVDVVDERVGEVVGDRAVHVDALRRDAALPGVAEPGDLDLGGGRLPVAVGLDDDRRVVAELEADLLARRPGTDAPADVGRAGERDQRDVGVVDDRVADRAAAAGDDVEVLGGQAALVDQHLGERDRAERRLAGRLQHHRAAGGDRRARACGRRG